MAECQRPFPYEPEHITELQRCLSDPRFNPFRIRAGFNDELAFEYYLYNVRLSKSLLFPLHVFEVTLRNCINEVISRHFSDAWWRNPAFLDLLTAESRETLNRAVKRRQRKHTVLTNDLVPMLTLDFWSNLFRPEYETSLWRLYISNIFPGEVDFSDVCARFKSITALRNRVAHHESILNDNVTEQLARIYFILGLVSRSAHDWLKAHSTVHNAMRSAPKGAPQSRALGERCDKKFTVASKGDLLKNLPIPLTVPCMVLDDSNRFLAVIDGGDLWGFMVGLSEDWSLLDFGDETLGKVVETVAMSNNHVLAGESDDMANIVNIFDRGARYVVVVDAKGIVIGYIKKSHRRY